MAIEEELLDDFSGGVQVGSSPDEFGQNQWQSLYGVVHEDERRLRTQPHRALFRGDIDSPVDVGILPGATTQFLVVRPNGKLQAIEIADLGDDPDPDWTDATEVDLGGDTPRIQAMVPQLVGDTWRSAVLLNTVFPSEADNAYVAYIDEVPATPEVKVETFSVRYPTGPEVDDAMPYGAVAAMWGDFLVLGDIRWVKDQSEPLSQANSARFPHALWFSQPTSISNWDPIDVEFVGHGRGDRAIVGLFPLAAGLLVLATDGVHLLRGNPAAYSYELVRAGVGPVSADAIAYWPHLGVVAWLDDRGRLWHADGDSMDRLDRPLPGAGVTSVETLTQLNFEERPDHAVSDDLIHLGGPVGFEVRLEVAIEEHTSALLDPGETSSDTASSPAPGGLTGDFEIEIEFASPLNVGTDWHRIVGQGHSSEGDLSWALDARRTFGNLIWLRFLGSPDGSTEWDLLGGVVSFATPARLVRFRLVRTSNGGALLLMWDGADWILIHGTVMGFTSGALHDSTADVELSGSPIRPVVSEVVIRNTVGGSPAVVMSPNFEAQVPGTAFFDDAQSNTWTLNGDAAIVETASTLFALEVPGLEPNPRHAASLRLAGDNVTLRGTFQSAGIVDATSGAAWPFAPGTPVEVSCLVRGPVDSDSSGLVLLRAREVGEPSWTTLASEVVPSSGNVTVSGEGGSDLGCRPSVGPPWLHNQEQAKDGSFVGSLHAFTLSTIDFNENSNEVARLEWRTEADWPIAARSWFDKQGRPWTLRRLSEPSPSRPSDFPQVVFVGQVITGHPLSLASWHDALVAERGGRLWVFRAFGEGGAWAELAWPGSSASKMVAHGDALYVLDLEDEATNPLLIYRLDPDHPGRGNVDNVHVHTRPLGIPHRKTFWHRLGVRFRGPGQLVKLASHVDRLPAHFHPAEYVDEPGNLGHAVVAPAAGPSRELIVAAEFEGDVTLESVSVWRHAGRPERDK